ncbi:MAG: right-handed parallel beta-helix repeat-containing protein [Bacteroidales bacterium]|nr:right-handed parallel beta-helix repeat-containing protein [Bacteroidales bacterium]
MKKNYRVIFVSMLAVFSLNVLSQTVILENNVKGLWTKANSPYLVLRDVVIPEDTSLTIEAGVEVQFAKECGMQVYGNLIAMGDENDKIVFTSADTASVRENIANGWKGIVICGENKDTSILENCIAEYVKTPENGSSPFQAAINVNNRHAFIKSCKIHKNRGYYGGAINSSNQGDVMIQNCTITDNSSYYYGGVYLYNTKAILLNNLIANNGMNVVIYGSNVNMDTILIFNNTIVQNDVHIGSAWGNCIFRISNANVNLCNTIIHGKSDYTYNDYQIIRVANSGFTSFSNCIVEGGEANIHIENSRVEINNLYDANPGFMDGPDKDYHLSDSSYGINSGQNYSAGILSLIPFDLAGNPRIYNDATDIIDIGAYEYQGIQAANRPPSINNPGNQHIFVSASKEMVFSFSNVDAADIHILSVVSDNPNITIGALSSQTNNAKYTLTPSPGWGGMANIILSVTDNHGARDLDTFALVVGNTINQDIDENTVWDADTVFIGKSFKVKSGVTLEIRPGVCVCFLDNYSIEVEGMVKALGSPDDDILFTSFDTSGFYRDAHIGWGGILLKNTYDSSVFFNCIFEYVRKKSVLYMYDNTAADFISCTFRNNSAMTDYTNPSVIKGEKSKLYIGNCLFYDNLSMYATIMLDEAEEMILCNSSFYNNTGTFAAVRLNSNGNTARINNCAFWNNHTRDYEIYAHNLDSLKISNCFVEGGLSAISNYGSVSDIQSIFDLYPQFNDSLNRDFHLTSSSPCINKGVEGIFLQKLNNSDMDGNSRIYNGSVLLPDIGPYEYQVAPSNRKPVLEKTDDKTAMLGKPVSGCVNFFDADESDTHTLTVTSNNAHVTVQGLSGDTAGSVYSLVPAAGYTGDAIISVFVEDNGGLKDSFSYTLHVDQHACGNIYEDMVWDADTILVNCNVTVNPGATLTIMPGAKVIFNGPYSLTVNGSIQACGTTDDPIVFTDHDTLWQGIKIYPVKEQDSSLLRNCEISNSRDGGIRVEYHYYNSVIISNCYIHHNSISYAGGGICNSSGPVLIENCNIAYNTSTQSGGGIYAFSSGKIVNNTICHNTSKNHGGGLYSGSSYSPGLTIEGNTIHDNRSTDGSGGGIYSGKYDSIKNNIISNNIARYNGGGINGYQGGYFSNNRIENNTCEGTGVGGGIHLSSGSYNVINNLIINNHSGSASPGVYLSSASGLLSNNTICNNTSSQIGSGIFCYGDKAPVLMNNILWGNGSDGSKVQIYINNELSQPVIKHCILEGGKEMIKCTAGIYYTNDYKDNIDIYPSFKDTVNRDYSLAGNSIAINSGCTDTTGMNLPATDILGNARIFNGHVARIDIGAYEYMGEPANRRPVLKDMDNINLFTSQSKQMMVEFLDTDFGDSHTITIESDGPNLTIENLSGDTAGSTYDLVAANGWYGLANVKVKVEDSHGLADSAYYSALVSDSVCGTLAGNTVWDKDTIYVSCDITVPEKVTLTVMPGTRILFTGPYKIFVNGTIKAVGTDQDRVVFISSDTSAINSANFWRGMVFERSFYKTDTSVLKYCSFQYGRATEIKRDNVIISNCLFDKCSAQNGGGIVIFNSSPLIENSKFSNNTVTNTGGAISCLDEDAFDGLDTKPVIRGNEFYNNRARHGGAFYSGGAGPVLSNNIIHHNQAGYGGALYFYYRSRTAPVIFNNLIYKNTATYEGGAIFYDESRLSYQFNNTIVKNEAGIGGGLYILSYAYPQVINDIIFYNTARQGGQQVSINGSGSGAGFYHCFIQYGFDSITGSGSGTEYQGSFTNVLMAEPLFADTVNHNYRLSDSSYCINAGTINISEMEVPEKDIEGNPRVFAGILANIDAGAYEFQGNAVNRKPIIVHTADQYTYISERKKVRVFFTDVDKTDTHTITVTTDNANVAVENKSGDISGSSYELVPATGWQGTSEITVKVTDDKGNYAIDIFNLIISGYYCGSITENTTWDRDTIKVLCDIIVEENATLTIMPGTVVSFEDHVQLKVLGRLLALGTNEERVTFTASDKTQYPGENHIGWRGIRFFGPNSSEGSRLEYCTIEYAKGMDKGFPFDNYGGGLYIDEWSDILVSNCIISYNSAVERGGGIYCNNSGAKIFNCKISNNQAGIYGGGLYSEGGYPYAQVMNTIICNNEADFEGGGIFADDLYSINNIVANNHAGTRAGGISIDSRGYLYNTIIWGSTAGYYPQLCVGYSGSVYLYNSILQGGLNNIGYNSTSVTAYENIVEQNPQFILPSQGAGIDYDGLSADWSLRASSPGINRGTDDISFYWYECPAHDINGENRVLMDAIDIGAFEYRNSGPYRKGNVPDQITHASSACNLLITADDFFADDNPGDVLTYSISVLNTANWMQVDATGGNIYITGTPGLTDMGEYMMVISATDLYNASVTDTFLLSVDEPTLHVDFNDYTFKIYPIPAHDIINLEFDKPGFFNGSLELIDINGKIIELQVYANNNKMQINISDVPSGIYQLRIISTKGVYVYKITIL